MKKFFYVAIAAIALMVVSCSQKTPAEEALANYKAVIEKICTFNGTEEELMTLMQEGQEAELEYQKYVSEYSQETLDEVAGLSMKAAGALFEQMAKLQGELDDDMEEVDELEADIAEIEEEITELTD